MNKNELTTHIPEHLKAPVHIPVEMPSEDVITEIPVFTDEVGVLDTKIGTYKIPNTLYRDLGGSAVARIVSVPGIVGEKVVIPGTTTSSSRKKVVIGGLSDYKGGNPGNVIGFDDIVRK